jgi:drug/metabolite transporter (DMT)-like permease
MKKKLFFALLCLIWGSTWLAIKIGLGYFPPFSFAAIRFALATLVVYCVLLLKHESISWGWSDLRGAVWFGIFNGIDYTLIFWAEQYIPPVWLRSSMPRYLSSASFSPVFWPEKDLQQQRRQA